MPRDPFAHGENFPVANSPRASLLPSRPLWVRQPLENAQLLLFPWGGIVNHLRGPGRMEDRQLLGKILHPIDFGLKSSHVAYSFGVTNLYL